MEAKNKMIFGRLKNRILRPKKNSSLIFGGPCGSGGRNKRMGEGLGGRNLKPNSEALSLEAGTERMK